MRRPLTIAICLLLLGNLALTQTPAAKSELKSEGLPRFTPAQLLEDFQIARRALEEGHSGIYRYTPKSKLDQICVSRFLESRTTAGWYADPLDQSSARVQTRTDDDGQIAQISIYSFSGYSDSEKKKGLRVFFKESFEELEAKQTRALILDLRNNGGGQDELGKLLLSYLVDEPFKYYEDLVANNDTFRFMKYTSQPNFKAPEKMFNRDSTGKLHMVGHPNWGTNQPSKPTFTGKVYILINGGSFSATSEFTSQAHYRKRATFIGEESAGGYYGNSSGFSPLVKLPNTQVGVVVPVVTYYMAVSGYKLASRGIIPDHPVEHTIEDLIAGKDRDLELALTLARKAIP